MPWKSGGAIRMALPTRNGALVRSVASGPDTARNFGARAAPLGTPVVPDVRITTLPRAEMASSGPAADAIKPSSDSAPMPPCATMVFTAQPE